MFLMEQNNILMVKVDQLQIRTHYYVLIGLKKMGIKGMQKTLYGPIFMNSPN